jgi:hypothetical protein
MPEVTREHVIEVCSELYGLKLRVVPSTRKHSSLATEDGTIVSGFPKEHGGSTKHSMYIGEAHRILREVAAKKNDPKLYELGKKMLRVH